MTVDKFVNIVISITLIDMMLVIGLSITFAQLWKVAKNVPLVLGALVGNFIAVPAVTAALLAGFHAKAMVAVGFLLLALCPGAPVGPPATGIAKGNIPIATGLMVILAASSAIVAPLLLPVLLPFVSGNVPIRVDPIQLLKTLLVVQLLPLLAGLAIHEWNPALAARLLLPAARLNTVLGLVVVVLIFVFSFRLLSAIGLAGYAWMLVLLVATLAIGWITGTGSAYDRKATSLTAALRNLGVALVIATNAFAQTSAVTVTVAYGLVSIAGSFLVAAWWGRT